MPRAASVGYRNAANRVIDPSDGPWGRWGETPRSAAHAIRWIERYCTAPKGHGSGMCLKLAPWERRWLRDLLGPRIRSGALSCPRGQGKSTLLAALGLWATFCPDEGGAPQVPIVATTLSQAVRSVYGVALSMIAAEPELGDRAIVYSAIGAMRVLVPSSGGEMFPVSHDPDGLQGLDPSVAICDEIGFQPIESWDSLLLASGKRPRSLVVGIGTPGLDRNNALWHLRSRVREGRALPGFVYREYAADEGCAIDDERQWRKANPALRGGYQSIDALRTSLALSPEAHFRIFRLGQWVDGTECWLGTDGGRTWDALRGHVELVPGAPTWVGLDVGLKRDSTALAALQRLPDGKLAVKVRLWLPSIAGTSASPHTAIGGPDGAVDVTDVMAALRDLDSRFDLQEVAYDPRFFDVPAKMLTDEGLPMTEIPQSVERMTQAVGSTFEVIKRGELVHDGDPAVTAQVLNAVARMNERGFTLAKAKSRGRIDAAIAICLAVDRCLRGDEGPGELEMVVA